MTIYAESGPKFLLLIGVNEKLLTQHISGTFNQVLFVVCQQPAYGRAWARVKARANV